MGLDSLQSGFKYKIPFDPPRNSRLQAAYGLLSPFYRQEGLGDRGAGTHPVSCLPVWFYFFLHLSVSNYSEFHPKVLLEPYRRVWVVISQLSKKGKLYQRQREEQIAKMVEGYKENGPLRVSEWQYGRLVTVQESSRPGFGSQCCHLRDQLYTSGQFS